MPDNNTFTNFANQATSAGLGIVLGSIADRRQLKQQEKLQQLQIAGQKQMMDYSTLKQLELWDKTNYGAQVKHLKNAGLNPGLLYGMGGAGGATTGSPSGSVTGANAPTGGNEIRDMTAMGIQLGLMQAQKRVLETQADKNQAEAEKTKGTDTQESQTRIQMLEQGIDNARQLHEIQKLEITLKNIENWEKQATQSDRLDYIKWNTAKAMGELQQVRNEAFISTETLQQKINIIRATAITAALNTELTRVGIHAKEQEITNMIQHNMREWDKMSQTNKELLIKELLMDYNTDPTKDATQNISRIIDNIIYLTTPRN